MVILTSFMAMVSIIMLLGGIQAWASYNWKSAWNSLTALESGFESLKISNLFSSPFFMMAILFVLFDIELVLLIPSILNSNSQILITMMLIITLMATTLMVEWIWSGLKWAV
uniref:NADH-ubiquinone oxidoreductase chain 3 n=1 Tax=Longidorus vineacola TaxID=241698 RepID=A0A1P8C765_9BILA|nr:NADH dehydrogenase subunit 3 [Longidorus vineacola]AOT84240.1 NADH dehydrogenase subunit 3 [Longidorus vineacola]